MTDTVFGQINRSTPGQFMAADPGASVWVSASAGTGKTHVLANRVLRLMLAGNSPQRIMCLTYTRAAAAQMANRINDTLGRWALASELELNAELEALFETPVDAEALRRARRLFARVLDAPGGLKIHTIHAFCQSLLGRFPVEAQLPPHFDLMDQRTAAELMADASQSILSRAQADSTTPLAKALAFVSDRVTAPKFQELTENLSAVRGRLSRLMVTYHSVDGAAARLRHLLMLEDDDDDDSILVAACAEPAFDGVGMRAAVNGLLEGGKTDVERANNIARWLADPLARAANFSSYMSAFLTQKGAVRATLASKKVANLVPEIVSILEVEADRLIDVGHKRRRALVARATESLLQISGAQLTAYSAAKSRRAVLDYEDLILETRKLLHLPGVAPWILYKLDGGIDHILIDEAQDTSPDQWQVIAALADELFAGQGAQDETRSVFAVGDVKQSIYGFQGADPAEFDAMHRYFASRARDADRPFRKVPLETSFRSASSVLQLVDEVFAPVDARDGLTFEDETIRHQAFREGAAGLVEIWPTILPEIMEQVEPWTPPVVQIKGSTPEEKTADLIAATIHRWLNQGELLEARGRAVSAGDILILVRRRTEFVAHLVRALKQLGVPVAGADRMVLTEQLAVMDLIALGNFVLLPADDLTLAVVLKGPLVGMSEEQLFEVAYDRGEKSLWQNLRAYASRSRIFTDAVNFLTDQLARADYMPPYEFYARVLSGCGGRQRLIGRLGPEANDPIDEFINLTLEYERAHPPSLQGFLHWIEAAETEVNRDTEHARDEVRVMTVHGAKGLEAPIVILPDTTGKPIQDDSFLWLDDEDKPPGEESPGLFAWPIKRDNETGVCDAARMDLRAQREREYRRLLYVALTRAEDRLYICGWETRNGRAKGCWYDLVADAFDRLPGVDDIDRGDEGIVRRLSNPQTAALKPPVESTEMRPLSLLPSWADVAPAPEPEPPQPLAPSQPDVEAPPVMSPIGYTAESGGLMRGRTAHRLLQLLPDVAPEQREESARRYMTHVAPEWGAQQSKDLINEVLGILGHSDFAPLFGPDSQAEVPIAGVVGEFAISGQIDRLVVTDHEILIIDYKTNRNPPEDEAHVPAAYLGQMSLYKAALAEIFPDHQIRCALLWTEGPRLMPLTDRPHGTRAP